MTKDNFVFCVNSIITLIIDFLITILTIYKAIMQY